MTKAGSPAQRITFSYIRRQPGHSRKCGREKRLMMGTLFAWLVVFLVLRSGQSAKVILFPFGHCFNSHLLNFEKLAIILTQGGHKVDMLVNSNYEDYVHHRSDQGRTPVDLQTFRAPKDFVPICDRHNIPYMLTAPPAKRFSHLMETFSRYCEAILSDRHLLMRLKRKQYDLFIFDSLDPCGRILADYLDVLFIPLMTTGLGHWDGNPRPPSYVPSTLSTFSPSMTFSQRTLNLLLKALYDILPVLVGFDEPFEKLKQKYALNTTLSIASTFKRAAIKFVNSDFAFEYPSPVEPDTIMVGGYSIDPPTGLTGKLENIVKEAEHNGIVVFSFGTLISQYNFHYVQIFMEAFASIPQTVIWRNENQSVIPTWVPRNVHMMPWIPQNALLAHPNTRLFVTHCGLNGAMEAAYFGVPVIAIPIADDQFNHANKLVNHLKMGVQLDLRRLSSSDLYKAINTVLNDTSYTTSAKQVSSVFKDQPMSKKDIVRFWVEWVLRHKGTAHFRSVAHRLTWYQYHSVDSLVFLVSLTMLLIWLLNLVVRLIISFFINHYFWYFSFVYEKFLTGNYNIQSKKGD